MDSKEYQDAVAGAGDDLVLALDLNDDTDLDEQAHQRFHEMENEHPLVIDEDKAIDVLRLSNHPTAEFFHHGTAMKSDESDCGRAAFPFGSCAAAALTEDVKDYLRKEYGFDGPLTRKLVKAAQTKLNRRK